ncbi:MAG: ABC transporter permease [Candidatus Methanoperedens sp.]|uniref:ABC transporter permease n=1 Tax=Candidatus Methanoperedens sp. BLZ2 TaxID=2035255 RepID=UPI000BE23D9E|nr:ABC transporter permease [Candidatus Methanoperedens sp. BLZ2]KAB2944419.1 MAG: ABC transporter [Candidatus Methanoperedens sp.]MBZ0174940.1 ABC transporter permease [Candidatus Methanoperedens nitroreducens]MCX9079773.1 ABC transporter permease [Candidatus Methanoperedens sp.]
MSEIEGIYAVWLREAKIYIREKERLISSVISPLLWIFGFGAGLGSTVEKISGYPYQIFIYPGIMVMTVLFTSLFYGVYIIWDRKLDFLKEVLVAPISRASVFAGKMLGGATDAMVQVVYLIIIGFFISIPFTPLVILEAFLMLLLISIAMVSIGLVIGANLKSPEGFSLVINFVMWPMFFFSGALFPVSNLAPWLSAVTYINPLTYGVDAMRGIILGINHFPILLDAGVLVLFAAIMMEIGILSFRRM